MNTSNIVKNIVNAKSYTATKELYAVDLRDSRTLFITFLPMMQISVVSGKDIKHIPTKGQQGRVEKLIERLNNGEPWGMVVDAATSIADWEMDEIHIEIYRQKSSQLVEHIKTMSMYRHSGFITSKEKICYIIDENASVENAISLIEESEFVEDLKENVFFKKLNEKSTKTMKSMLDDIRNRYGKSYFLMGGSANSGLVLFSNRKELKVQVDQLQKLAKIILAGGVKTTCPILVELKDLSELDGIAFILSDIDAARIAKDAMIPTSSWYQIRCFEEGKYAAKGVAVQRKTNALNDAVDGNHIKSFMDVNTYNKTYGLNAKEGDVVEVSKWLILKSERDMNGSREINLSYQLISRLDSDTQKQLIDLAVARIASKISEAKNNPASQLNGFGFYGKMKQIVPLNSFGTFNQEKADATDWMSFVDSQNAGTIKMLDYKKNAESEIFNFIKQTLNKGIKISGSESALVPVDCGFDECYVGRRLMKKLGINLGDRITIMRYPIMPGNENGNPSAFSKKVIGKLDGNLLGLNLEATSYALGDFDGDSPLITTEFIAKPQVKIDYSISKGTRRTEFMKPYEDMLAIEAFLLTGSEVGVLDQTYETVTKTLKISNEMQYYIANCIQASIYKMKHNIVPKYGSKVLSDMLQKFMPQLFDGNKKLIKHDDIVLRKDIAVNSETTNEIKDKAKKLKKLTVPVKSILTEINKMKYVDIKTYDIKQFRSNALDLYVSLGDAMGDGFIKTVNDTITYLYSLQNMSIDVKNYKMIHFAKNMKQAIGEQAFYALSVALCASERFKSMYIPFMFSDVETLRDIQNHKANVITQNINVGGLEITENTISKTAKVNKIRIFRSKDNPCIVDGCPVVNIGDTITSISQTQLRVIGGDVFNVNVEKSVGLISGNRYEVTKVSALIGKDGKTVISGLDIEVK